MAKTIFRVYITSSGEVEPPDHLQIQERGVLNYLKASESRLEDGAAFSTLRSHFGYHGVAQFVEVLHRMAADNLLLLAESDKPLGYPGVFHGGKGTGRVL